MGKLRANPSKQVADLAKDIVHKVRLAGCSVHKLILLAQWKKDVGPARAPKTDSKPSTPSLNSQQKL